MQYWRVEKATGMANVPTGNPPDVPVFTSNLLPTRPNGYTRAGFWYDYPYTSPLHGNETIWNINHNYLIWTAGSPLEVRAGSLNATRWAGALPVTEELSFFDNGVAHCLPNSTDASPTQVAPNVLAHYRGLANAAEPTEPTITISRIAGGGTWTHSPDNFPRFIFLIYREDSGGHRHLWRVRHMCATTGSTADQYNISIWQQGTAPIFIEIFQNCLTVGPAGRHFPFVASVATGSVAPGGVLFTQTYSGNPLGSEDRLVPNGRDLANFAVHFNRRHFWVGRAYSLLRSIVGDGQPTGLINPNRLYFSEVDQNTSNAQFVVLPEPIRRIAPLGDGVAVFTSSDNYLISGDFATVVQTSKLPRPLRVLPSALGTTRDATIREPTYPIASPVAASGGSAFLCANGEVHQVAPGGHERIGLPILKRNTITAAGGVPSITLEGFTGAIPAGPEQLVAAFDTINAASTVTARAFFLYDEITQAWTQIAVPTYAPSITPALARRGGLAHDVDRGAFYGRINAATSILWRWVPSNAVASSIGTGWTLHIPASTLRFRTDLDRPGVVKQLKEIRLRVFGFDGVSTEIRLDGATTPTFTGPLVHQGNGHFLLSPPRCNAMEFDINLTFSAATFNAAVTQSVDLPIVFGYEEVREVR